MMSIFWEDTFLELRISFECLCAERDLCYNFTGADFHLTLYQFGYI